MIALYHGSNVEIKEIDLSLSRKGKDRILFNISLEQRLEK